MEEAEVIDVCEYVLEQISGSERKLFVKKYSNFLDWFGMGKRLNANRVSLIDKFFNNNNVTVWCRNEERNSVADFDRKAERITFRLEGVVKSMQNGEGQVAYEYAGTIEVAKQNCPIVLYKHQEKAIKELNLEIIKSGKTPFAGLLVLPTGGGKTLTAAYWLSKNLLNNKKKILWIAHRHELLEQAKDTFHERLAFQDILPNIQSFNYRIISGIHDKPVHIRATDDLIIASKDSLNSGLENLLTKWLAGEDEVFLVIDEAHHATAKTYRMLIESIKARVKKFRMLGLTATPFRTVEEEKGLLAKVFPDDIIYKIDLQKLIILGILSKPVFESVDTEFDIASLFTEQELDKLGYSDIDKIGENTAEKIAKNGERNRCIVDQYCENKERYKKTLIFALNRDNAIALRKLFQVRGIRCDLVLSGIRDQATGTAISPKENKEVIKRFREGELDVLINVNILTEGTDLPNVQTVFLTRPTISSVLMTQMIGRGLRGEIAGGTKEAYIVSFIDNWQDKVAWINPEKLFIEENIDFSDKQQSTRNDLARLISISKIEEFALFVDANIDETTRQRLESMPFIERLPIGFYHFSILTPDGEEAREKNCEILVYNNLKQDYEDLMSALPELLNGLPVTDYLSEEQLDELSMTVKNRIFYSSELYPGYNQQDIKDILQFYYLNETTPAYLKWQDRERFDITKVAEDIIAKNLRRVEEEGYKSKLWDDNVAEWNMLFGRDKRQFLRELSLAISRLSNPGLYEVSRVVPTDRKELRSLELLSMSELKATDYETWQNLSRQVFDKQRDSDGYYFSAKGNYRSKSKLNFQIDHIKALSKGGLTALSNLQLLTRKENALKGTN